jgi:hypothetical protein
VVLDEGDAVHFDSSAAHSYRLDQGQASAAILVVMPEPN